MEQTIRYETTLLTPHLSPEQAQEAATGFLLEQVGNQLVAGDPQLMVSAVRTTWIVPVLLSYLHSGVLGSVGVIAVDDETGLVTGWTPISQIKSQSRQLRESHEPELTQAFQTAMTKQASQTES